MHRAFLTARPKSNAVVHLHSTYATAISCLASYPGARRIPWLTPYFVMRIGKDLPMLRYFQPGDVAMEEEIYAAARTATAVLLANHGTVVSGRSLPDAVYAAEELEEAAKLATILGGKPSQELTLSQVDALTASHGHKAD